MNNLGNSDRLALDIERFSVNRQVEFLERCDSTNRVARQLLQKGAGPGLLVAAEAQSAGRGRQGRVWQSEPGSNLLFSLVLAPKVSPERMARCVLIWAAAMAEVLDCRLKWPNDLQDPEGRKLGGILSELYVHDGNGAEAWWVILGVGLNVNQRDFPGLPDATSLCRLRGHAIHRSDLLQTMVQALESWIPVPQMQWSGGSVETIRWAVGYGSARWKVWQRI